MEMQLNVFNIATVLTTLPQRADTLRCSTMSRFIKFKKSDFLVKDYRAGKFRAKKLDYYVCCHTNIGYMTDDCCYARRHADVPVAPALFTVYFVPMVLHVVHLATPLPSSTHFTQLVGHAAARKTRYSYSYQLSETEHNNTEQLVGPPGNRNRQYWRR